MELTINGNNILESISNYIMMYLDCVIEIANSNTKIYCICNRLSKDKINVSVSTDNVSIGDTVDIDQNKIKYTCDKYLKKISESDNDFDVTITPKIDYDYDIDYDKEVYDYEPYYKEDYLYKQMIILSQKPMEVFNTNEAVELFRNFVMRNDCKEMIFKYDTYIPYLDNHSTTNLVIDKNCCGDKILVSFVATRPDFENVNLSYPDSAPCICELFNDELGNNIDEIANIFSQKFRLCFIRCCMLNYSEDNVKIYAYSNCKLK